MRKIKVAVCVAIIFFTGTWGWADDVVPLIPLEAAPKIEKIEPLLLPSEVPSVQPQKVVLDSDLPTFYAIGAIEVLNESGLVLNDGSYSFAKDVNFYSEKNKKIRKSDFILGTKAGLLLDDEGNIIELWKMSEE
ncbi:hypothetical protein QUF76_11840 [Desulfobacterales bacterium HSG16]|nr:hypothetical protein [Desulfobacterales bacterium HSG16]